MLKAAIAAVAVLVALQTPPPPAQTPPTTPAQTTTPAGQQPPDPQRPTPDTPPPAQEPPATVPTPPPVTPETKAQDPEATQKDTAPAEAGSEDRWWSLTLNDLLTLALAGIVGAIAFIQMRRMGEANDHIRTVERAWVTMNHRRPGIMIDGTGRVSVAVIVKNSGRTPAQVTDVYQKALIVKRGTRLPKSPDYLPKHEEDEERHAYLVADGDIQVVADLPHDVADKKYSIGGKDATHDVYVIGYVDYIDSFGVHHRSGYARVYHPDTDDINRYKNKEAFRKRDNLIFVSNANYNYDRVRRRGEGDDWD
jgi:hypothetical protein